MQKLKALWCIRALSVVSVLSFSTPFLLSAQKPEELLVTQAISKKQVSNIEECKEWKNFHSVVGKCKVAFPDTPEHVKQTMTLEEDDYNMQYDVYVSADKSQQAVFMVLIAQYPPYINETHAEKSLECFLNGILSQHPNNQLVFADLIECQGHKGMDFFIKTKGLFFKGRVVMAGSNLYLVAMECEEGLYKDNKFNYFINSFELVK